MKKLLLLISCFFLIGEFFCSDLLGQVIPDSIKDYPGIPIISYLKQTPSEVDYNPIYRSVDSAGLYAVQVLNMKSDYLNNRFAGTKFKILPDQIDTSMNSPNSIKIQQNSLIILVFHLIKANLSLRHLSDHTNI